jgi:hypothetical protein
MARTKFAYRRVADIETTLDLRDPFTERDGAYLQIAATLAVAQALIELTQEVGEVAKEIEASRLDNRVRL